MNIKILCKYQMLKIMKAQLLIIVLFILLPAYPALAFDNQSNPDCQSGICIEDKNIVLTSDDIKKLKAILKEDELPKLKYEIITLKNVIIGHVYLLSAQKPHHYGIEIVLSRDLNKWNILKKVKSIY